ncbi:DNA mismatch repair protein Mlh1 [Aspergillus heterothallicus]
MEPDVDVDMAEPRGTKRAIEEPHTSHKPRKIRALDPNVVNKIAAGEIIVAPMHALKELIENAVDAGSTSLEILVKEGGLKLLQITDNGHGIDREDLSILCERFTTSKLKEFEDLLSIGTYGFRGEALASISHIAHLTVTTKTAESSCAWRAHYSDGKLVAPKPGQSAEPKATAGRGGTQITVEDLFYNVPTRRRAFRSASEEYAKVLDVVGRYAVHCSGVAFSCRKHGDAGVSISTAAASNTIDRIRQIHGSTVANELVEFDVKDEKLGFLSSGLATNANYYVKRTTILLFINHRSVESTAIKRAIEQTYATFLPKGGHPFVYLDIEIEPHRLDVNVHPTKREVNFLNEDEIIETICDEIRSKLAQVDSSRTFLTQTLLPSVQTLEPQNRGSEAGPSAPKTPAAAKKPYENNLVRTDSRVRKITSMLTPTMHRISTTATDIEAAAQATPQVVLDEGFQYETTGREPNKIPLTSVKTLRAMVRNSMHSTLTETIASHTYVGLVDEQRRIAAIQSGVKLYLIDYGMFCNEFFYQIGLTDFGNFGAIKLDPAPKLVDIIRIAADAELESMEPRTDAAAGEEREIFAKAPEKVTETLIERKEMLSEYFSIEISDDGHLLKLPLLLKGYLPSLSKLPRFLLRLGPYVNWEDEQECFRTFLKELAAFYTPEQLPRPPQIEKWSSGGDALTSQGLEEQQGDVEQFQAEDDYIQTRRAQMVRMLEHVIFPALRARLVATAGLLKGVIEVADLKGLYRVFERC